MSNLPIVVYAAMTNADTEAEQDRLSIWQNKKAFLSLICIKRLARTMADNEAKLQLKVQQNEDFWGCS